MEKRTTIQDILEMKRSGRKITMLTAYDYPFARLLDAEGVDMLLVGDSVGTVIAGHETTLPVTMDEMVYHTRAVVRGTRQALVVADMPFLSYQIDGAEARRNAGRLIQEGGASAVKLEGGEAVAETIASIVRMEIPVMGHVGLTPQSVHRMGGFRVQGREAEQARRILADARAVADAGAFAVVLEGIPRTLAREISQSIDIPTIGIGAGPECSGQVLVIHDLLGLCDRFSPKFVKRYADLAEPVRAGVRAYLHEVREGVFPADEHCFN